MIATGGRDPDAYDTYRLEQIQRTKRPADSRRAGEQADRIASALPAVSGATTRRIAADASPRLCRAPPEGEYRNPTRQPRTGVLVWRSTHYVKDPGQQRVVRPGACDMDHAVCQDPQLPADGQLSQQRARHADRDKGALSPRARARCR